MSTATTNLKEAIKLAIKAGTPVMLWGSQGIGKSSLVNQVGADLDMEVITLILSQKDAVEIGGYPKVIVENGHEKMVTVRPHWFPKNMTKAVIVFLDETNRADRFGINAVHELALENRIGDHVLPKGSIVICACNFDHDGETGISRFGDAFFSRFSHLEVNADANSWVAWARESNVAPEMIDFIAENPSFLNEGKSYFEEVSKRCKFNPRGWNFCSKIFNACDGNKEMLYDQGIRLMTGMVGSVAASAFIKHVEETLDKPMNYKTLTNGSDEVKEKIARWTSTGKLAVLRATLEGSFAEINKKFPSTKSITQKDADSTIPWFQILREFPADLVLAEFSNPNNAVVTQIISFLPDKEVAFIGELDDKVEASKVAGMRKAKK